MFHFVDGELLNRILGCSHVVLQGLCTHMGLPQLMRFPVLVEHEMSRIFIVLMPVVINAAFFSAGNINQFF